MTGELFRGEDSSLCSDKRSILMEAPEPIRALNGVLSGENGSVQAEVSNLAGDGQKHAGEEGGREQVRIRRETLQGILEQCQKALQLLKVDGSCDGDGDDGDGDDDDGDSVQSADPETAVFCDLLKSRVESPAFLDKLGSIHVSVANRPVDEGSSWDIISETDLLDGGYNDTRNCLDQESYVVVHQEDIVDGIACFMATYLSTLKQTKELTPKQLQEALAKTFSTTKKKGKLRKVWDSSKVIYNVFSWGATAVGIYQNPALIRAASVAFWTSCRAVSKFM